MRSRFSCTGALSWGLLLACLNGCLSGCQGSLAAGIDAFEESRFPDAVAHLRSAPPLDLDPTERTRWALYQGLGELALGNLARALPALRQARCLLEGDPTLLSLHERGQLESAWRALGQMPSEPLGPACVTSRSLRSAHS